jgi:hypothetical protein
VRQYHRLSPGGLLLQVGEYLVDDHGIFDTEDDFDRRFLCRYGTPASVFVSRSSMTGALAVIGLLLSLQDRAGGPVLVWRA